MRRLHPAQEDLRKFASSSRAKAAKRFFKTGPGEYGEGDVFIGASVPETRSVAKKHLDSNLDEIALILQSAVHEDRLLALLILVGRYQSAKSDSAKDQIAKFYLRQREFINNWDLVDTSAYKIIGQHCLLRNDSAPLDRLIKSSRHWDRRIAMVGSFAFIRLGQLDLTYKFASKILDDSEDLMHKAGGWMLREAGKKDQKLLRHFIKRNGKHMPRTMLRYAIEKFSTSERQQILTATKS
jgi:3-methyladenine DNA glycosylase AlkD